MTVTSTPQTGAVALPEPGRWTIDRAHSSVGFVVRHLVVAKVRGHFTDYSGEIVIGEQPENSSVQVEIAAASINTGDAARDEHLRSPDFFDVEQFPSLTFASHAVRDLGGGRYDLDGDLSIGDVTRPVTVDLEYGGVVRDPYGNEKAVFSAQTKLNREAFGLTWNAVLEAGGVTVGKEVTIEIEVEAQRAA